ncbi:MAG: hypothetical protein NTW04_02485, partial [Elusimicrobia bacterium]|nr:hypothetical protein [Elusimicrobiota bacterium]
MKLLILLDDFYRYKNFHLAIDHDKHDVSYIGMENYLRTIPALMKCKKYKVSSSSEIVEEAVKIFGKKADFDRVLAVWEMVATQGAELRKIWNISHGQQPRDIEKTRDKLIMKNAVSKAGVKVPPYASVEKALQNFKEILWSGKTVLKPVSEAGSVGIKMFNSPRTALDFICASPEKDNFLRNYELEEFIDRPVCHANGLVENGRVVINSVDQYLGTNLEYSLGKGIGSVQIDKRAPLQNWVSQVIGVLDIKWGAYHLEFFYSVGEPIFLEIANRCGGGTIIPEFELKTGVYLPAAELSLYINDTSLYDWRKHHNPSKGVFGGFTFPGHLLKGE